MTMQSISDIAERPAKKYRAITMMPPRQPNPRTSENTLRLDATARNNCIVASVASTNNVRASVMETRVTLIVLLLTAVVATFAASCASNRPSRPVVITSADVSEPPAEEIVYTYDDELVELPNKSRIRALVADPITDAGLGFIAGSMPRLEYLIADPFERADISDASMRYVVSLKELRVLGLPSTAVTDDGLMWLKALPNLVALDVSHAELDGYALESFPRLRSLSLFEAKVNAPQTWRSVGAMKDLRMLDATGTGITNADLPHLLPLHRLSDLRLGGTAIDDDGLETLRELRSLKRLDLSATKISGSGLRTLRHLTQLEELDLSDTSIADADLTVLHELANLKCLWIYRTKITPAGIASLQSRFPGIEIDPERGFDEPRPAAGSQPEK